MNEIETLVIDTVAEALARAEAEPDNYGVPEQLAEAVQRGEPGALARLFEEVRVLLYLRASRYYFRYRDHCDRAGVTDEDLKQSSFFAVVNAAKAYNRSKGFRFTTYLNKYIMSEFATICGWRTSRRDALNLADSLDAPLPTGKGSGDGDDLTLAETLVDLVEPTPDELAEIESTETAVREAVQRLPDDLRDIIVLRYFDGLTIAQAAERLSWTEHEVRARTTKAIAKLYWNPVLREIWKEELEMQEQRRREYFKTNFAK